MKETPMMDRSCLTRKRCPIYKIKDDWLYEKSHSCALDGFFCFVFFIAEQSTTQNGNKNLLANDSDYCCFNECDSVR